MKKQIQNLINSNSNIRYFAIEVNDKNLLCLYIPEMCNVQFLQQFIIPKIEKYLYNDQSSLEKENLLSCTKIKIQDIENYIFIGNLIVIESNKVYAINIANLPKRSPETSASELTITGSKDAFIENIDLNIILLQKRLKTPSLNIKEFNIGNKLQTKVKLVYLETEIDKNVIKDIENNFMVNISHVPLKYKSITVVSAINTFRNPFHGGMR